MSRQAALPLVAVPAPTSIPRIETLDPIAPRRRSGAGSWVNPAASALETVLHRAARRGEPVTLGTAEDPYTPPADGRSPVAALRQHEGLEVLVTTRSPEILRDLDRLVDLDRRCSVTVDMVLAALDPFLVRRLEPGAPEPKARLRAVARLAAEGIAVRIVCAPLRSGLNDRESALRQLFAAAQESGALDVVATQDRPTRLARLRGVLSRRHLPDSAGFDARLAVFRRLRLEHGFPRPMAGRG
jgi:DNA repair photolyase